MPTVALAVIRQDATRSIVRRNTRTQSHTPFRPECCLGRVVSRPSNTTAVHVAACRPTGEAEQRDEHRATDQAFLTWLLFLPSPGYRYR
jgi:hypothetical protein